MAVVRAEIRGAAPTDLVGAAQVFLTAFPESVHHYVGHPIGPQVLADALAICLAAEPAAFSVAVVDATVAGYIIAPTQLSRVFATALWRGHLLRLAWRWLTGRYGIGVRPISIAVRNFVALWREAGEAELGCDARILSVAVDPRFQGQGLGNGLLRVGLDYLAAHGVPCVRLEVRPDNAAAVHLYEKYGFRVRGRTHDTQGEWLVMLRETSEGGDE